MKKREKAQIFNLRNERDDITTYSIDIKRIKGEQYIQLYANKCDHLDETNIF